MKIFTFDTVKMKQVLFLLAGLICVQVACRADENGNLILNSKILIEQQPFSIYDITSRLRKVVPVEVESDYIAVGAILKDNHPTNLTAELATGEVSIGALLTVIKEKLGYDYEISNGVISFVDPRIKQIGEGYALNALLTDVDITDMTAIDAVNSIAQKFHLPIGATTFRRKAQLKHISIRLNHVSMREALNIIAREAGLPGWNSNIAHLPDRPPGNPVIMIVL